jgi:hypothetical protein
VTINWRARLFYRQIDLALRSTKLLLRQDRRHWLRQPVDNTLGQHITAA